MMKHRQKAEHNAGNEGAIKQEHSSDMSCNLGVRLMIHTIENGRLCNKNTKYAVLN